jgi:hypothetical protein
MVNAITAAAPALTSANSIVLYQNILPERYSIIVPFLEVIPPGNSDSVYENYAGHEVLYYDRQGHIGKLFQKGLLINTYF